MNGIVYMKKVVGLLAGLCLCAGCENEIPEPTASVVSAGKFVVDYTTAAGAATRVIHENQPKRGTYQLAYLPAV